MSKGKLHELLAVEADLEGRAKVVMNETQNVFKNGNFFQGFHRTYKPFVDDGIDHPVEQSALATTVNAKLDYAGKAISQYYDALLQKESTNQVAVSDLVVDGQVIAEAVPATFLLGMESRLKTLRGVYAQIPTLDQGIAWQLDEGKGKDIYVASAPEESMKTQRTIKSKVLYEARFPKEGESGQSIPAVIDKWEEVENVGKYTKNTWCGMITPARKSELLDRIDQLLRAVKKARQRANTTEVVKSQIGAKLMDFINA